jgi:hypothetical protein
MAGLTSKTSSADAFAGAAAVAAMTATIAIIVPKGFARVCMTAPP